MLQGGGHLGWQEATKTDSWEIQIPRGPPEIPGHGKPGEKTRLLANKVGIYVVLRGTIMED